MFADMVADGGKSVFGALFSVLGASGLVVGVVMGLAEATSLILRLVSGPLVDRAGNHWRWVLVGYGLTAVCIPLLALTPALGAAGLGVAAVLIVTERVGKAIRSPAKTALLAQSADKVGVGRGFGVHKTLDLVGAFSGPLLVAAVIAATGHLTWGFAALLVPGALTMVVLALLRSRIDSPVATSAGPAGAPLRWKDAVLGSGLPRQFYGYAVAVALTTGGLVSYGVISFHLADDDLLPIASLPLAFAAAMVASMVAALVGGWLYDGIGGRVLLALPPLVALVPGLAMSTNVSLALVGVLLWGAASGLQDSTIKAVVATLVTPDRRATAYGVFAAAQGIAAAIGGAVVGGLYDVSLPALIAVVAAAQVGALVLLLRTVPSRESR